MSTYHKYFLAALACFVLAGSTGALFRFGPIYGIPGLNYGNVRHAHSHLMAFAWATPGIMALMGALLPRLTGRPLRRGFRVIVPVTIGLGLIAYVPYFMYGYSTANIGGAILPPAAVAAMFNIIAWYVFAVIYFMQVWRAPKTRALWLMNASVIFMLLATMGIMLMPFLHGERFENPLWGLGLTHMFLDGFIEGWFVPAILAFAYATMPDAGRHPWARVSGDLLVAGLPFVFLLSLPIGVMPPALRLVGSLGGLLVAAGTLGNVVALWGSTRHSVVGKLWRAPLFFLALKSVVLLLMAIPVTGRWVELVQLRIFYLHIITLGTVTLGLFAAAERQWLVPGRGWMTATIVLLILTLIPLTGLWPLALGGPWTRQAAAWATLGPVLVAIAVLIVSWRRRNSPEELPDV
ncbi:MAG: cbb3-type cytochrome c oxidase subunit I [Anaerolineae bacterium]|nr:cbb3-type cytochrome c oxidase subunit I [Anaerolineae bacterium]